MINIKRILCPTELSPYSGNAVRYALALARAHDAELIVLHCTDSPAGEEELRHSMREFIDPQYPRCRFVVVPANHVDEQIMATAQAERTDGGCRPRPRDQRRRADALLQDGEGADAARLLHLGDRLHESDALRGIAGALRSMHSVRCRREDLGTARVD